jgi:prepilin-type N-terminal cleavage/methylation domain-containing protein
MKINARIAFTLTELLIALAVIAILLSVAIPNYARSREESHKNSCVANLRQINSGIDQWAMENKISVGTVPSDAQEDEIYAYLKGTRPKCPGGGVYAIHGVGSLEQVTCTLADKGHSV